MTPEQEKAALDRLAGELAHAEDHASAATGGRQIPPLKRYCLANPVPVAAAIGAAEQMFGALEQIFGAK